MSPLPGISHQQRREVSAGPAGDARTRVSRPGSPVPARSLKLSILMPAYNEQRTIVQAINEVLDSDYPCDMELIVVDDGSTDRTEALLSLVEDPRLAIHRFPANQGKGAALLAAASFATGTHILPFDADLEYSADDIPKMVEPVLKGRCDVVYGVRLFGCNTVYRSYRYALGNRLLTRTANILFNACLSDLHTCLKLMPLAMLRNLKLVETGFGLDSELTAVLLRRGVRPFEVPVSYYSRSHAEGKKITWRNAVECIWILLRVRFRGRSRLSGSSRRPGSGGRPPAAVAEIETQQAGRVRALAAKGDGDELSAAATG
jgi:glycosyltransferase involved in cell wall biosynthesis